VSSVGVMIFPSSSHGLSVPLSLSLSLLRARISLLLCRKRPPVASSGKEGPVITASHCDCRDRLTHENVIRISLLSTALRTAQRVYATLSLLFPLSLRLFCPPSRLSPPLSLSLSLSLSPSLLSSRARLRQSCRLYPSSARSSPCTK